MIALTRRARRRRLSALAKEVHTLREVAAVAMRDTARARALLAEASKDSHRNAVPLPKYVEVCNRLHRAEDEIRHLKSGHARG